MKFLICSQLYFLMHKRYRSYRHYFYSVVHKAPSDLVTEIQNKNIKWQRRKYITVMRHLTYQENGVFVYHQNRKIYKKEELQISSIKILSKKVMGRNGSKWIANFVLSFIDIPMLWKKRIIEWTHSNTRWFWDYQEFDIELKEISKQYCSINKKTRIAIIFIKILKAYFYEIKNQTLFNEKYQKSP